MLRSVVRWAIPPWLVVTVLVVSTYVWLDLTAGAIEHPVLSRLDLWFFAPNLLMVAMTAWVVWRDPELQEHTRPLWIVGLISGAVGASAYWWWHLRPGAGAARHR